MQLLKARDQRVGGGMALGHEQELAACGEAILTSQNGLGANRGSPLSAPSESDLAYWVL